MNGHCLYLQYVNFYQEAIIRCDFAISNTIGYCCVKFEYFYKWLLLSDTLTKVHWKSITYKIIRT